MEASSLQTCGEYYKHTFCIVLVERKIPFSEVPCEGIHKQILFYDRTRERGKTCDVDNKEHKTIDFPNREKAGLFDKGKVRKKVPWDKVAEQFNANSSVKVTGEQCANKWKKLEDTYKKVREHNAKTGNDKKDCDFEDELAEFFRSDPKIIPPATVSSLTTASTGSTSADEDAESSLAKAVPKKKRKRRSKSSKYCAIPANSRREKIQLKKNKTHRSQKEYPPPVKESREKMSDECYKLSSQHLPFCLHQLLRVFHARIA